MSIGLLVIVVLLVAMWFLLIRPTRRRQAQQQDLLSRVEVGDEIVTAGGLYGHVESIDEHELRIEIAPGTVVRVARRAVAAIVSAEDEADEEGEEREEEPRELEAAEPEPEEAEPAGEEASSGSARR